MIGFPSQTIAMIRRYLTRGLPARLGALFIPTPAPSLSSHPKPQVWLLVLAESCCAAKSIEA
jgi:hypothetical protein